MEDKRRFPRWTVGNQVFFKEAGSLEEYECLSKDISSSGLCFSLPKAVLPDTELDLKIHLGSDSLPISAKARVMWIAPSTESQGYPFKAGVIFDNLKDPDKEAIFNYAYRFRREELLKCWWAGV